MADVVAGAARRPARCSTGCTGTSGTVPGVEDLLRGRLGGGDVGLVERVDAEEGAGERRRRLPQQHPGGRGRRRARPPRRRRARDGRRGGRLPTRASRALGGVVAHVADGDEDPVGACRPRAGRAARRRSARTPPVPCLPVDSAMSCSTHRPKLAMRGSRTNGELVPRRRGRRAEHGGQPGRRRQVAHQGARPRRGSPSRATPARAAGTRPKRLSAE